MTATAPTDRAVWIGHTLIVLADLCGDDWVEDWLDHRPNRRRLADLYATGVDHATAADTIAEEADR